MKKMMIGLGCCLLALALGAVAEPAQATEENVLERLKGQTLEFSSGVGAWNTTVTLGEDGAFTGLFHDSEMGEMAEAYPNGTVYGCLFHGQFSDPKPVSANEWRLTVALEADEGQLPEVIEDGVRYVTTEPYGLKDGQEVVLYAPGTPVNTLPESLMFWTHLNEIDPHAETLPFFVLWNEAEESGFVGELPGLGPANPWTELSEEEFSAQSGVTFGKAEGAEGLRWFLMKETGMAELRFRLQDCELCARICPAEAFTDISGIYAPWQAVGAFNLGRCPGAFWADGGEDAQTRLCLWYDAASGVMYSLSAAGNLPDGLDLVDVAQAVYVPLQADAQ